MSESVDVVVVGAGPYGLSAYAHLRGSGLRVRIFGETMRTWRAHMPDGMFLKSAAAASDLSAPEPGYTLADFCRLAGVAAPTGGDPVPVELFIDYGQWFARRLAPRVEQTEIWNVARTAAGFRIETDAGEMFDTRSVVVASGLIGHAYIPPELAVLTDPAMDGNPAKSALSHSSQHSDLSVFAGREVVVVGAGQSALESAALLAESGARPTVLARRSTVVYADPPAGPGVRGRRSLPRPDTPLGPGFSLFACVHGPAAFRHLPDRVRLDLVARILGPFGAWWLRDRVEGVVPVRTGCRVLAAAASGDGVTLRVAGPDGREEVLRADHVLAATGYRIGPEASGFLDGPLRESLTRLDGWPRLGADFASSVPGLYFVGFPAAASFGPLMRFVCGTPFAAPRVARALTVRGRYGSA